MEKFEVIIVGAGPAGGECARTLSKAGKKVLLLEKAKDFSVNSYSSGGAPLKILEDFDLPPSLVDTFWNKLSLSTSHDHHHWKSSKPMGVVLDFMKLRQFLARESEIHGAEVRLQNLYLDHEKKENTLVVRVRSQDQQPCLIETRILVDATGTDRKVLSRKCKNEAPNFTATGIEYHVEVNNERFQQYANTLSFYLGSKWMRQGYAWVFPLRPNILKIGIIRYFASDHSKISKEESYPEYLDRMMEACLGSRSFPILDRHGKTLVYTYGHRDPHYDGSVIAIGDGISTLNPLAAEGIRHAMASARIASSYIIEHLEGKQSFAHYPLSMKSYYGYKWALSEILMKKIYRESKEENIDRFLKTFKTFSFQELLDLAFSYKLNKAVKFYTRFAALWMKDQFFKSK